MSVKVQSGGMFNSYRAQYSPETHKLLKLLMDEVKLTSMQRQKMNESLKKGDPLPVVRRRAARPSYVDENLFGLKKNYYFSRRSQEQIIHSGAYDRERYRFLEREVDLEKEKERLRDIMEYGKNRPKRKAENKNTTKTTAKKKSVKDITPEERMEELVFEIEDRLDFLREMESMGQGKHYEATIKQEIASKLREMKTIDKNLAEKYLKVFDNPKAKKSAEGPIIGM